VKPALGISELRHVGQEQTVDEPLHPTTQRCPGTTALCHAYELTTEPADGTGTRAWPAAKKRSWT
jgi:hypothetical protein